MQTPFLSHADAALRNRNSIIHYIKKHSPISRTDIWNGMSISRASVTQLIRQLEEDGLILESGEGISTGGRKPQYIRLNGRARKILGFDWLSKTLCLMGMDGELLYEKQIPLSFGVSPAAFAASLKREIALMTQLELYRSEELLGFGLSLPGLIDSRNAFVVYSVELNWRNISVKELFSDLFGKSVFLERTGNAVAMGEYYYGASKGADHMQLYLLGTDGIGVSTVIHSACQHGANFMSGELGHIKMPGSRAICSCGQSGCLEAVVGELLAHNGGKITDDVLEYLALGVATAINISDISSAILTGSYVNEISDRQRDALVENIRSKITNWQNRRIDFSFVEDTKQLALRGIGAMVFNHCFPID